MMSTPEWCLLICVMVLTLTTDCHTSPAHRPRPIRHALSETFSHRWFESSKQVLLWISHSILVSLTVFECGLEQLYSCSACESQRYSLHDSVHLTVISLLTRVGMKTCTITPLIYTHSWDNHITNIQTSFGGSVCLHTKNKLHQCLFVSRTTFSRGLCQSGCLNRIYIHFLGVLTSSVLCFSCFFVIFLYRRVKTCCWPSPGTSWAARGSSPATSAISGYPSPTCRRPWMSSTSLWRIWQLTWNAAFV